MDISLLMEFEESESGHQRRRHGAWGKIRCSRHLWDIDEDMMVLMFIQ